jgi:hypothetical protein
MPLLQAVAAPVKNIQFQGSHPDASASSTAASTGYTGARALSVSSAASSAVEGAGASATGAAQHEVVERYFATQRAGGAAAGCRPAGFGRSLSAFNHDMLVCDLLRSALCRLKSMPDVL